ncbi:MAG: hypothetical protein AAGJ10_19390 [Bacteroidota bacterium]
MLTTLAPTWLWIALAAVIGFLIGWWLRNRRLKRYRMELAQHQAQLGQHQQQHQALQAEYDVLVRRHADCNSSHQQLRGLLEQAEQRAAKAVQQHQALQTSIGVKLTEHQQHASQREAELQRSVRELQTAMARAESTGQQALEEARRSAATAIAERDALQQTLEQQATRYDQHLNRMTTELRTAEATVAALQVRQTDLRTLEAERDALQHAADEVQLAYQESLRQLQAKLDATARDLAACREAARRVPKREIALPVFAPLAAAGIPTGTYEGRDDLQRIKGVGPFLERKLHDFGIFTFRQIAALKPAVVDQLGETFGSFKDRIIREGWVEQAERLMAERTG